MTGNHFWKTSSTSPMPVAMRRNKDRVGAAATGRRSTASPLVLIQNFNARVADHSVPATATEVLKTDVAAARTVLQSRRERIVVALHWIAVSTQIHVLNFFAVQSHQESRAAKLDV